MTDLTNKVIWITGASSGIGKALAQTAAQHDTKLILSGRRTEALDALADELAVDCLVLPFEVTDFEALEHKVEAAWAWQGRVDILVNNAVTTSINTLMETTLEDFDAGLRVGPMATLRLLQLAQSHLIKSGDGNIINLATAAAKRWDTSTYGVYAAEKEAIRALSRGAACEWGSMGIRTNCILPLAKSPALEI